MNNELLELIKTRRSCRKYTAEQVSDEQLAAVMEAGTYAPRHTAARTPSSWQCSAPTSCSAS